MLPNVSGSALATPGGSAPEISDSCTTAFRAASSICTGAAAAAADGMGKRDSAGAATGMGSSGAPATAGTTGRSLPGGMDSRSLRRGGAPGAGALLRASRGTGGS